MTTEQYNKILEDARLDNIAVGDYCVLELLTKDRVLLMKISDSQFFNMSAKEVIHMNTLSNNIVSKIIPVSVNLNIRLLFE